jgi:integrase
VEVARAVSDVAGQLIVGPTKTYGNRHVPMPPRLLEELSTYLGPRRDDPEALVFTGPQGGTLRHGNFYKWKFKPATRMGPALVSTTFSVRKTRVQVGDPARSDSTNTGW